MATFFLCMIYAAFISLGLPDSLLGAAWPAMQPALGVPLDSAGVLSMIVAGGTVVASLSADRMLHRFGTGRVTLVSVTMTACALLGYALAPGFWWLALAAVPMGLGAGAVDAGLNNFVALHYEARHMSWLHCFWGVGATLGPVILSLFLGGKHGWRGGYGAVCAIQFCLVAVLAVTLLEEYAGGPRNTLVLFDRFGERKLVYAKVHTCDFDVERELTPGEDFYVCALDTACGEVKVGAMICYDREFPESARVLMLKGAELILVPNACPMEINRLSQLRGRAFENMLAVATCNYPASVPDCNGGSSAFDGVAYLPELEGSRDTCILQADKEEGIYLAALDLARLRAYRECEAHGNAYRRPEKYRLLVEPRVEPPFVRADRRK